MFSTTWAWRHIQPLWAFVRWLLRRVGGSAVFADVLLNIAQNIAKVVLMIIKSPEIFFALYKN
jgi:hypothetical protein